MFLDGAKQSTAFGTMDCLWTDETIDIPSLHHADGDLVPKTTKSES